MGGTSVRLDTRLRAKLVNRMLTCLEEAAPGSKALLRGSLARNKGDQYSDIDVLWEVPDPHFKQCVDNLREVL